TLLICVGLIAICTRFPYLVRQTDLSLAHAIGVSILFSYGVGPAAWTMLFGLLAGELWWFFAPAPPVGGERPGRMMSFRANFVQQLAPLIVAGGFDRFLAGQFALSEAGRDDVALVLFSLIFLVTYNVVLALEVNREPGAVARFFRENVGAVGLAELLPMPLVFVLFGNEQFSSTVTLVVGGVMAVLALRLNPLSYRLLADEHRLREQQRQTQADEQRLETLSRQLTLTSARAEVAQRNAASSADHARHYEALLHLGDTLHAYSGANLSYEMIIRQISEATRAHIGQLGLISSSGHSVQYLAAFGLPEPYSTGEVMSADYGIAGRALRMGQPVRVANVVTDPDYVELHPGIRSEMAVPLLQGDRRLGLIRLLSRTADAFSAEDEAFAVQAAGLVTLTLSNAQLAEEIQSRKRETALLFEAGTQLAANLDVRIVQRTIVQKLAEAVDADRCTLADYDAVAQTLRLIEPWQPRATPLADYVAAAQVLTNRQPLVIHSTDAKADPREAGILRAENMSTGLLLPMLSGDAVTGVVRLYAAQPRQFSASDLAIAQTLANQAALALQNARSFQRVIDSRDRLAAILNSTREGVLVVDASGLISLVNPRVEELWNIPVSRLLNQPLLELLDNAELDVASKLGLSRDEAQEMLLTLRAGLAISLPKAQYSLASPKVRHFERSGAPVLDQFERAIGWVIILRDLTEEKELQQVRDTLGNMIVHDLRSPLTAMVSGLGLIRDRLPTEHQTPIIRQSLDIALRSTTKMIGLVSTLLDISQMESGEIKLNLGLVYLAQVVEEAVSDLLPLATDQGLLLVSEVPPALPHLQADYDKISRVFTNLIDNALKFSPPGGQVLVRATYQPNGHGHSEVTCAVLDSGPGIPEDYRDRIFDRFVQVEGRRARRPGT
ncbi:MAG: GAF domain-containing protein, partial [Anaerolineales bacterium]